MEPEARYAWVGVSVLVLLTAMIGALLWLVASGGHGEERTYRIYFARQSLEGLQIRSDVLMKGIRIGAVSGFTFSATRPGTVEATVAVDPAAPVRESTRAIVERNLVTGLAIIRLVSTTEDSPLLTTAPPGERDPVIAEGASQLQRVSDSLNLLAARADETMRRINMSPLHRGRTMGRDCMPMRLPKVLKSDRPPVTPSRASSVMISMLLFMAFRL